MKKSCKKVQREKIELEFVFDNQYIICLAGYLGLRAKDIAEIGGFTERHARGLMSGSSVFSAEVASAIVSIERDIELIVAKLNENRAIYVYPNNENLRTSFNLWPKRGHAEGGFIGPHRVAAISAYNLRRGGSRIVAG